MRPSVDQPSVQNLFNNPDYSAATPSLTGRVEPLKRLQDMRVWDFMARMRRSREQQLARHCQDSVLPVFSNADRVTIKAHTNQQGNNTVDYLQQCEEEVRVLFEGDALEIDMMNAVEKMLADLPVACKVAQGSTDFSQENVDKAGNQFISMVEEITTYGVNPEDDLVAIQDSLQALYVKNIAILEGTSIKEKWVAVELTKLKGEVKEEAHSRAHFIIKQAKKDKMKAIAKDKISRRETRVHELIDTVEASANKVNSEETAAFVEGVGGQLSSEAHILDAEIDELAILDPGLADHSWA